MNVTILLVSLADLAFKISFYNDHQTLKNTKETAAYIHKIYQPASQIIDTTVATSFIPTTIQPRQREIMMAKIAAPAAATAEVTLSAQRPRTGPTQLIQQEICLHRRNANNA